MSPLVSLQQSSWFKLICGASFQDLSVIRSLVLIYTLAGADCIDLSADEAVVNAAQEGLLLAQELIPQAQSQGYAVNSLPWLMISLNDAEDPHFRKAQFDPNLCPTDCSRPCVNICPADAITFTPEFQGVINQRCYGCGRCLPICPIEHITANNYISTPETILPLLKDKIQALEIHTKVSHCKDFEKMWSKIKDHLPNLQLLAISCPDDPELIDYLTHIAQLIQTSTIKNILWQTDGRPMSGDIGMGTTHAAIKLGEKVLSANLPGYVQLAGGTNHYTVAKLRERHLLPVDPNYDILQLDYSQKYIGGIAYGSYARVLLSPILQQLTEKIENHPKLLWKAVSEANKLVSQLKGGGYNAKA